MLLNQGLGAPPAFFSKPFITTDSLNAGGIAVSSGDAFKHRAFDMSPVTQATSQGQAADGNAWTYDAKVYIGSTQAPQNADCVALLNFNGKNFKVEYRVNGGAWTIFPGTDFTVANFSGQNLIAAIDSSAPVLADEWLLTVISTQTPNQEKAIGYFLPCRQNFQASRGTSDLNMKPAETIVTVKLADGTIDQTIMLHNDADFALMKTPLRFIGIPDTEEPFYAGLRGDFFLLATQPNKYPANWYLCRVVPNSYNSQPLSKDRDSRLMLVSFQVEEVGGA